MINLSKEGIEMEFGEIMKIIRHRYPFLLLDKIIELEVGKRAIGVKYVSTNDKFLNGYFLHNPLMPGTLIVEALAQVSAIVMLSIKENNGRIGLLAGIDHCYFNRGVKPGEELVLEVEITRLKGRIGKGKGKAKANGEIVCEADLIFAFNQ